MFTLSENNNLLTKLDWLITLGRGKKHGEGPELSRDRARPELLQLIPRADNMMCVCVCVCVFVCVYPTCLQIVALVHTLVVQTGGVLSSTHHAGVLLLLWTQDGVTAGFLFVTRRHRQILKKKNYSLIWSDVLTRSTPASHIFCGEPGQLLSFLFVFVSCCTATLNLRTVTQLDSLSLLLLFAPPCHFPRHTNIYFGRKKGATLGLRRGGLVGESSL